MRLKRQSSSHSDAIVEEIHRWRKAYAARFDNDLNRIFADLQSKEPENRAGRKKGKQRRVRPSQKS